MRLVSPRFQALALALLGCGFVVACGDADRRALQEMPPFCQEVLPAVDAHMAQFEEPSGEEYGGTAVVGGLGELSGGMNSLVTPEHMARQHQEFVNLMTLVQVEADLEYRPHLARQWEFDPGAGELTFHLRDDVYWHDGQPTTAHDVAFTYRRASDPATGFFSMSSWEPYVDGPDAVEVLDDHTVRFRVEPHAEPLEIWRLLAIMPGHLLEDVPPEELRNHPYGTRCPVGNGPFVFQEHRPGASWSFVRNPGFPEGLGGPPRLDRYVYRVIPEQGTLLTELLTGSVDVYLAPNPDVASRIDTEEGARLLDFTFREYVAVVWNTRRAELADRRVRRALTLGVNRQEIIDATLGGFGEVANAGVPPFHWAHHPGLADSLRHDPDEARRLLDEAGWVERGQDGVRENEDGIPLNITVSYNMGNQQRQDIAQIMQAQLAEIGVGLQPEGVEWGAFVGEMTSADRRNFDGAVLSIITALHVSDYDQFHSTSVDQPMGLSGVVDDEMDHLLDTLQVVVDRHEAIPLWHRYQERVVALQPYTYFFFPRRLAGVGERLQGVEMDVRGDLMSVSQWWIPAQERRRP